MKARTKRLTETKVIKDVTIGIIITFLFIFLVISLRNHEQQKEHSNAGGYQDKREVYQRAGK